MKIIDQTPYISENGEVTFINQIKASLKFGFSWLPEIRSQQIVIDYLNRNLTKGYTLLRNIVLPGSDVTIPLILVGPAGLLLTTHLKGTFQAKGDNWGLIEDGKTKQTHTNLLVRTSRMGRAIQRYLAKQGEENTNVDGILIATDPGMHIESVRPIVRVVMMDAIEHFIVSINHSSLTLSPGKVQTLVNLLTEPASLPLPVPPVEAAASPALGQETKSEPVPELNELLPWSGDNLDFEFNEDSSQAQEKPFSSSPEPYLETSPVQQLPLPASKPFLFDKKQWILLIAFGVVEIIILLIFFWMILSNS
jgi:hypothetical protein